MRQILQDMSSGETKLVAAPSPRIRPRHVLIDTAASLISTGTERMLLEFGSASLLEKARQNPGRVTQVLDKVRTDGLMSTIEAVRSKLAEPIPLGYCNVGIVREVAGDILDLRRGDRVVSNGPHADVICVSRNLCARVPDGVSNEKAAFTIPASIGLQGIRLAEPTLGESFAVIGTGLIGLLTVQLLKAHGCRVLAVDVDASKLKIARQFGAETCHISAGEDPVAEATKFSRGRGVDGVIIAAATKSHDPVSQSARMCRKRGRIILVGVAGLSLNREDFYEKELTFQVSCSYGPGRYDPVYEEMGQDYPVAHVRWTEQRNFEAVLDLFASGSLRVDSLISYRHQFDDAIKAYQILKDDRAALGIVLNYRHDVDDRHAESVTLSSRDGLASPRRQTNPPSIGVIGAGNYASRVLIPAFKMAGAQLRTLASASGTSSAVHGLRAGFAEATSNTDEMIADQEIDAIVIATRHNTHADFVVKALRARKHVFVEKPLALTITDISTVESAHASCGRFLMVGFNRRFAPHTRTIKRLLSQVSEPKAFVMVMNAGAVPVDHWTQDPHIGGGRIIGEACHYIDLMRYLAGAEIISVQAYSMGRSNGTRITEDKSVIVLTFSDGSFGTIHYLANGASSFSKERIEVFVEGRTLQLDNFRKLRGFNWPGFRREILWRQDKGHKRCVAEFLRAIESGESPPIPASEIFEVARVTIEAADMLRAQG